MHLLYSKNFCTLGLLDGDDRQVKRKNNLLDVSKKNQSKSIPCFKLQKYFQQTILHFIPKSIKWMKRAHSFYHA